MSSNGALQRISARNPILITNARQNPHLERAGGGGVGGGATVVVPVLGAACAHMEQLNATAVVRARQRRYRCLKRGRRRAHTAHHCVTNVVAGVGIVRRLGICQNAAVAVWRGLGAAADAIPAAPEGRGS